MPVDDSDYQKRAGGVVHKHYGQMPNPNSSMIIITHRAAREIVMSMLATFSDELKLHPEMTSEQLLQLNQELIENGITTLKQYFQVSN